MVPYKIKSVFNWCHYLFIVTDVVAHIQEEKKSADIGRLFAVVHIDGKQRKVTTEDLVVINGFFPPQIGDKIRLEKVGLTETDILRADASEIKLHLIW